MGIKFWLRDKKNLVFLALVLVLLTMPFVLTLFRLTLLGKFICYAIVALGIDLIWGYTGILSLGHGVFFGLGAYAMAMHLKLVASGSSLPEFMVTGGLTQLPAFWKPFASAPFAFFAVIALPLLLALVVGFSTFKNRIKGVYFSILSQALAWAFVTIFVGMQAYTGGSNGITGFTTLLGIQLQNPMNLVSFYYLAVALLFLTYVFCTWLMSRGIGKILIAIRDGENRTYFTGYDSSRYKTFIYCISAIITGIAGAVYVLFAGMISPKELDIAFSVEMVIWVAVGGRGTLIGAVIGALLVNAMKTGISETIPDMWLYFIGLLFVLVVLFMPKGLVGVVESLYAKAAPHLPAVSLPFGFGKKTAGKRKGIAS
ncbi:urea ABC transporter permease subunit UrtC [uncultured Mitsuokella sp.]|uniref:urea ABC transporter permease subunit UrtC n=1 Tax=uncultured Mitsuokella sp. TaxID=453120 RepID=UPI0025EC962B|nr:urea ABC transporter permease subunit UrtC [uncultured Mitsuokella sp.]